MTPSLVALQNSPFIIKSRKPGKPLGTKRPKTKGEVRTTMATTNYRIEHPSMRNGKGQPPLGSDTIPSIDHEENSKNHDQKAGSLDPELFEMNVGN